MPWEFYRLTPGEFALVVEHHGRTEETANVRMAWTAAHFLAGLTGKTFTPEKLLGAPLHYLKPPAPKYPGATLARLLGDA